VNSPYPSEPSPIPPPPIGRGTLSLHEPGALEFDSDHLPWQRSLRWVKPQRDWRTLAAGLLFALFVTLLQLVGLALGMRPYRVHSPVVSRPVEVVRIQIEPDLPIPPEPEPPPLVMRPPKIPIATPQVKRTPPPPRPAAADTAMHATIENTTTPAALPQLFNADGSIRVGASAPQAPSAPKNPRDAAKARWAEIEKRGNPVDCHKTRFAQAYVPDESLGDKVSGKYLKWIGLANAPAIAHRNAQRAESGGCAPAADGAR
jgi:hypothetical protein